MSLCKRTEKVGYLVNGECMDSKTNKTGGGERAEDARKKRKMEGRKRINSADVLLSVCFVGFFSDYTV